MRSRTSDPNIWREIDSLDICQSVLVDFITRVRLGEYWLEDDKQLRALLSKMAVNKMLGWRRRIYAARRDAHRRIHDEAALDAAADSASTPSQKVQLAELLNEFAKRLTPAERTIAEKRKQGASWEEIASELGGSPNMLRMGFSRSISRISRELEL